MVNALNIYSTNVLYSYMHGGNVLKRETKLKEKVIDDKYYTYGLNGKIQKNYLGQYFDQRI